MSRLSRRPYLCLITDRQRIARRSEQADLIDFCRLAAFAGVDLIQIREKDLKASALVNLTRQILDAVKNTRTQVLVNDRLDVALAASAHGVHLTSQSLSISDARKIAGGSLVISVSTHSAKEAVEASLEGADYVLLSPIYDTPSKREYGAPIGLAEISKAVSNAACPVLALGGIDLQNYHEVLNSGAAGIAAIRLFTDAPDLPCLVATLRA